MSARHAPTTKSSAREHNLLTWCFFGYPPTCRTFTGANKSKWVKNGEATFLLSLVTPPLTKFYLSSAVLAPKLYCDVSNACQLQKYKYCAHDRWTVGLWFKTKKSFSSTLFKPFSLSVTVGYCKEQLSDWEVISNGLQGYWNSSSEIDLFQKDSFV